jgi:protein SCO1
MRMSARARILVLAAVTALVLAVALVVLLVKPAGNSPSAGSSAGASAAGSATGSTPGSEASGSGFDGAALPGLPAHDFTLADQSGRRVSLSRYRGQVAVVTFLYSTCGPTCVVIAQQIRGALDELPHPVAVLIISANPAADTPSRVKRFLAQVSLTGRVSYLTGPRALLAPLWRAYGVVPASSGRDAFDRSASVFLLDASGRARVVFQAEQLTPEALAHDIRKLS